MTYRRNRTADSLLALRVALLTMGAGGLSLAQSSSAPRDIFVDAAPGVRIHVRAAGVASEKHTVVFIPGWRLTASIWKEQLRTFSKDRRVIAIDPRSQGDSSKNSEGNTPEQR